MSGYEPKSLRVSDHSDQVCLALLAAMSRGDFACVEKHLAELERVYHYAVSAPSWRGFFNLTHCFRALLTDHLLRTSVTAAETAQLPRGLFPHLTPIGVKDVSDDGV